jgi:hypothetical protein
MSRELRVNYQGSAATLYAIIRRLSDDYAWNGSAFEAWADGHLSTYTVALTDRGGDTYDADFPTAIVAGDYAVDYFEQAGGSAATDRPSADRDATALGRAGGDEHLDHGTVAVRAGDAGGCEAVPPHHRQRRRHAHHQAH